VQACRRNANKVTHELALTGKSCNANEAIMWDADVPAKNVAEVVVGDLPQLCNKV
jgi:hypothetical protein